MDCCTVRGKARRSEAGGPRPGLSSADPLTRNTGVSHEITLGEEEISDVSLATFYVLDKENAGTLRSGVQLAMRGCGGCRGFGGCRGCRGCVGFFFDDPDCWQWVTREEIIQSIPVEPTEVAAAAEAAEAVVPVTSAPAARCAALA
jgi:hypothetical protein